ncbi:MAG: tyrosine-type recombinase/integrase [Chloroflexi bacterium]|nr:tyrosine-type recombinase/integrase [Chloroflexota bacterium]
MEKPQSLEQAYQRYTNQNDLRSVHTVAAYTRAIEQFLEFLGDRRGQNAERLLPVQRLKFTTPEALPPERFSEADQDVFKRFAEWLLAPGSKSERKPYAPATVEVRVAGVLHWFQFMEAQGWLSPDFSVEVAANLVRNVMKSQRDSTSKAVNPGQDLQPVVYFYDSQAPPRTLTRTDSERYRRWELTRLRNRAFLHSLAETGGRVSELLNLDVAALQGIGSSHRIRVEVIGKGHYPYLIVLHESLAALRDYLRHRGFTLDQEFPLEEPLFISHDKRYEGSRMSRIVAWRIVRRAAQALGMAEVSPQDFRHWRAIQLIQQGIPLHEVQSLLGHRSVETIRLLYAHVTNDDSDDLQQIHNKT